MGGSCLLSLQCRETEEKAASSTGCEQAARQGSRSRHHAPPGTGYPGWRFSLCFKSQANKETRLSLTPSSPVLGLRHSNKDWLISSPLGMWKIQNVVVQGCMFRF